MALVGGGGAPNVSGSNPAGTGTSLNYIGNHAYAYSGAIQANTSSVTHLEFTTGNSYIHGTLYFTACAKLSDISGGAPSGCQVSFDDQVVSVLKAESQTENSPTDNTMSIIIPPYTRVKVEVQTTTTASGFLTSVTIVGRVY